MIARSTRALSEISSPSVTSAPGLRVSSPLDRSEREAELVANRVLSMPTPASTPVGVAGAAAGQLQRSPGGCECSEEVQRQPIEQLQRQPEEEEDDTLQRSPSGAQTQTTGPVTAGDVHRLGSGSPLSSTARRFFEPRFGTDLSGVRVHTSDRASGLAQQVGARAFTYHQNIAFAPGQYQPDTSSGRRLLAHELTHTLQQRRGIEAGMVHRLGANPGCSADETRTIHQAIFNARGWVDTATPKLEATPPSATTLRALRRNFGPTYGVAANLALITGRVRRGRSEVSTIQLGCQGATGTCAAASPPCGFATAGGHAATICQVPTLRAGQHWIYQAGCVLHESFHAAFTNFTVDEYSGWHGHSGSSATYPGTGTDPLLNADSYTKLVMDLS